MLQLPSNWTWIGCRKCRARTLPSASLAQCCESAKAKGWEWKDDAWHCPKCKALKRLPIRVPSKRSADPALKMADETQGKAHIFAGLCTLRKAGWSTDQIRDYLIEKMHTAGIRPEVGP